MINVEKLKCEMETIRAAWSQLTHGEVEENEWRIHCDDQEMMEIQQEYKKYTPHDIRMLIILDYLVDLVSEHGEPCGRWMAICEAMIYSTWSAYYDLSLYDFIITDKDAAQIAQGLWLYFQTNGGKDYVNRLRQNVSQVDNRLSVFSTLDLVSEAILVHEYNSRKGKSVLTGASIDAYK